MASYGVAITARNDNYGNNLPERAAYCLNSMQEVFDEVMYVDWNTEDDKVSLIEEMGGLLIKTPKLRWVRVTQNQAKEWTFNDPEAQAVCEVMARNVGLRRLNTDYMLSSNIDIIPPKRHYLENRLQIKDTMITAGKRSISLYDLRTLGSPHEVQKFMDELISLESVYGQQPSTKVRHDDDYSLVSYCGDFQYAHRNIWYAIKGFEERLYKRGYADTNVQKKAKLFGFKIEVDWVLPVWHIGHDGGMGGSGGMNDMNLALTMNETTNLETWGHSDIDLKVNYL